MTLSKLNVRILGMSFLLMIPFIGFSANIGIIESQSNHPMQVMDANWATVVSNMGHTYTILPQTTLDDISFLQDFDILILSSGLIDLPMNRRETVKDFFMTGRSMYLQSEYQLSHPGNMMFEEIILDNGNSFNWEGESSGSITPMSITGNLSTEPNGVAELSYYWYGTYGNGDSSVIPFLEKDGKNYGFTYCPASPELGRLITTTDQDWVRIFLSEELMQNIMHTLVTSTSVATPPLVSATLIQAPDCENGIYNFSSSIQNQMANIEYQWQINGTPVPNTNSTTYSTSDLSDGDVVECLIQIELGCSMYSHLSNPILIAPILPLGESSISITSNQTNPCEGSDIQFNSSIQSEGSISVVDYQWQVNSFDIPGANQANFSTTNLNNNDIVSCNFQYTDACNNLNLVSSNEVTVSLNSMITPSIEIIANNTSSCEGEEITFVSQGTYWGSQPDFQWQINGLNVGQNENTFSTNTLVDGAEVSCIITSNEDCLTSSTATSNIVSINISTPLIPTLAVTSDHTVACENETITFTANGENWGSSPFFSWKVNGQSTGNNEAVYVTDQLADNDEVTCTVFMNDPCISANEVESIADLVDIQSIVTPSITITTNTASACIGSEIIFTAEVQNGGSNPVYEWFVDNNTINNNTATFSSTDLQNGQIVSCQLTSSENCVATTMISSNQIGLNISDITLVVNQQKNDYCGLGNGKIQVGTNFAIAPISYSWNNGETTASINDLPAGNYEVTATDALGCSSTLSVNIEDVEGLEIASLDVEQSSCDGTNGSAAIYMADNNRTYFYTWMSENGDVLGMESIIRDLPVGNYMVEITDESDCYLVEEFVVTGSAPVTIELEERMTTNWGDEVKLEPFITGSGNLTYEWSPAEGLSCTDCPNPTFSAETETTYTLQVTNEEGCSETKSILIFVKKAHDVFIPNAFSPNGDGQNDFFTAFGGDKIKTIKSMQVADRWGNILFKKQDFDVNDEAAGWDGTSRGQALNVGVYLYTVEVEFIDGRLSSFGGDVTLAR